MDIAKDVYDSLLGDLIPEYAVPWVVPIFSPGNLCFESYAEMHRAYERLSERLGVEEDPDVEIIINSLLTFSEELSLKMFEYGMLFQENRRKP